LHNGTRVLVLAEPLWAKGHFETQMQLFLSVLLPGNCRVIVLCAEPDKIHQWIGENMPASKAKAYAGYFSMPGGNGGWRTEPGRGWMHLGDAVRQAEKATGWNVDIVCITYLDAMIGKSMRNLYFEVKFDYPWAALYFVPDFLRIRVSTRKRISKWLNHQAIFRSRTLQSIGVLDEGVEAKMRRRAKGRDIFILPDVTDTRLPEHMPENIAKIRQEAGDRTIIGLVGLLQKRKGLLTFLRAMTHMDQNKCFFLIAGYLPVDGYSLEEQEEIKRLLDESGGGNGYFDLNYIEDPRYVNAYIDVCDVLYLCYERFYHSSGILTKAAAFRKPVITTRGYCMGERTEKYGFGLTVTEGNILEIVEALEIMSDKEKRRTIVSGARFDEFMDFHNAKTLGTVLFEMLGVEKEWQIKQ